MQLQQFIEQKLNELKQQYRQVELISQVSVTFNGRCLSEKFTAGKTPTTQTGREVARDQFPSLEEPPGTTLIENGTKVTFNVWGKGKRKPESKSFYFLWD